MSVLLHISDTHFGTEQPKVVAALVSLARERRPQLLVLSGDLTQRAQPAEFAAARTFCDQLGIARMLVLPGNHDLPLFDLLARATRPYGRYLAAFGPRLEPVLDMDGFLVIGVNTTRAARHKNGEVSQAQIARVAAQLRTARSNQLRIVVTHQPADVLREADRADRLRGAEPALQAWSQAGADLVLGGHIHLPYVLDLAARAQPTPRAMWCVQAGTAVSCRVRHGTCNSVNLIAWGPQPGLARQCSLERWDYAGEHDRFEIAEQRRLPLDA
ncbi:MAG: metallophosphoesterase family protein [Ramlibacter sp.]